MGNLYKDVDLVDFKTVEIYFLTFLEGWKYTIKVSADSVSGRALFLSDGHLFSVFMWQRGND